MLVAAPLGDGRDAGVLLECGGVSETVTLLSERSEQPGGEDPSSTGQILEEPEVGELLTAPCNLLVQPRDAGGHSAELGQERLDEKAGRLDDCGVGGQRPLGRDGVDAAVDDGRPTHAVRMEEVDDGLASSALRIEKGGPPLEERDEDLGLLVAKQVENLREIGLQRERETIRDPDAILHQVAARLDEAPERAHVWALVA